MLEFDKIFFPTPEEELEQKQFLEELEEDARNFWLEQGLTDEQYNQLRDLEAKELAELHPFQEWHNRQWLLERGKITLEEVLKELEASTL